MKWITDLSRLFEEYCLEHKLKISSNSEGEIAVAKFILDVNKEISNWD